MKQTVKDTLNTQAANNEKIIAWLRLSFGLAILPDIFWPQVLQLLELFWDITLLAYFIVAGLCAWRFANYAWARFALLTGDLIIAFASIMSYLPSVQAYLGVHVRTENTLALFVFTALMGCFFIVTASLRLSRFAVIYATAFVVLTMIGMNHISRNDAEFVLMPVIVVMITGILSFWVMQRMRTMLSDLSEKEQLARFLPPELVEHAAKDPSLLRLGGKRQSVSMMFVDIRGFSELSVQKEPEQVVEVLNQYFREISEVVYKYRGTLDKFMGDAMMALFGAPIANPDDADRAVEAACEIMHRVDQLNAKWKLEGKDNIAIGIGINTDVVIAGNIGTEQRMDYTVIGDGVNVASRLEKMTKQFNSKILISQSTKDQLTLSFEITPHGKVQMPGRTGDVEVYGVNTLQSSVFQ